MKSWVCFLAVLPVAGVLLTAPVRGDVLYSNGAINGNIDAWFISTTSGYSVSDSFTLASPSTITGVTFGEWVGGGATPVAVDWGISASAFGTDLGSATGVSLTSILFCSNSPSCSQDYGYDVYASSFTLDLSLGAGTYWLTLQNATASDGGNVGWDENDGPSSAQDSLEGTIGSESFEIDGSSAVPEPGSLALGGSGLLLLLAAGLRRAGK